MRRIAILIGLTLAAAGCGEDDPVEGPQIVGTSARVEPDEESAREAEAETAFAVRRDGAPPDEARCPEVAGACVNELDFAVYVSSPDWDHHWVLDYGSPDAPIRAGAADDMVWMQRLEAGVRYALAADRAPSAMGRCGLAAMMPVLYGAPNGYFRVPLPAAQGEAPAPVSPAAANEQLQAAYARIGYQTETPRVFFDEPTMARMTADTLSQPVVTRRGAFVSDEGTTQEALLFVVFSPESRRVYTLDRSTTHPNDETETSIRQRQLDNQAALLRLLSNIGESPVAFAADAACEIPEPLGGRVWRPLTAPWQDG